MQQLSSSSFPLSKFGRLFSAGMNGHIIEWDLVTLSPKSTTLSYGGPVWSLAIYQVNERSLDKSQTNNSIIAAGCEDGSIRLFKVTDKGLDYEGKLSGEKGTRFLTLDFSPDGARLLSGDDRGLVRVWDIRARRTLTTLGTTLKYNSRGKKEIQVGAMELAPSGTLIWSVLYLASGFIAVASSDGQVQFFDGKKTFTLLQSFMSHESDVLTLAANPQGTIVFAAGVDYKIVQFQLINSESGNLRWLEAGHRRCHTHDVRALVYVPFESSSIKNTVDLVQPKEDGKSFEKKRTHGVMKHESCGDILLSGGIDTFLAVHPVNDFPKIFERKITSFPQAEPCIVMAAQEKILLATPSPFSCQLWQLDLKKEEDHSGSPHPQLLFEARLKQDHAVITTAIHPEANYFAISTRDQIRLFKKLQPSFLVDSPKEATEKKVNGENNLFERIEHEGLMIGVKLMQFYGVSRLAGVTLDNRIFFYSISENNVIEKDIFAPFLWADESSNNESLITSMAVGSKYFAFCTQTTLFVHSLDEGYKLIKRIILNELDETDFAGSETKEKLEHFLKIRQEKLALLQWAPICQEAGLKEILIVSTMEKSFLFFKVNPSSIQLEMDSWSQNYSLNIPYFWKYSIRDKVVGLAISPLRPKELLFWGVHVMAWFNWAAPLRTHTKFLGDIEAYRRHVRKLVQLKKSQKAKNEAQKDLTIDHNDTVHVTHAYRPLLFCGFAADGSLVVVERPWMAILKQLPEPFHRARYGN